MASCKENGTIIPLSTYCTSQTATKCDLKKCHKDAEQGCQSVGAVVSTLGEDFIIDSGSSLLSLRPTFCKKQGGYDVDQPLHTGYASSESVQDYAANYPLSLFDMQTPTVPVCSTTPFVGTYNVIGVAPTGREFYHDHSFVNSMPSGDRRLTIDKSVGTVCFGRDCAAIDEDDTKFSSLHKFNKTELLSTTHPFLPGQQIIVDTGSTTTWKANATTCVVGWMDIEKLDVDYDNETMRYKINDATLLSRCGPDAAVGPM